MQKRIISSMLFLIAVSVNGLAFGQTKTSVPAKASTPSVSIVPQDVKTAIGQAVQDPVVSAEFLCQVWQDSEVQKYLAAYPSLTVSVSGGGFTFWSYIINEKSTQDPILVTVPTDGETMGVGVSIETRQLACAESACTYTQEYIASVKQSAFWAAMKTAIAANVTKEPRTARK